MSNAELKILLKVLLDEHEWDGLRVTVQLGANVDEDSPRAEIIKALWWRDDDRAGIPDLDEYLAVFMKAYDKTWSDVATSRKKWAASIYGCTTCFKFDDADELRRHLEHYGVPDEALSDAEKDLLGAGTKDAGIRKHLWLAVILVLAALMITVFGFLLYRARASLH